MAKDLGVVVDLSIFTDATAAIGSVRKRGLGRIRHLDATDVWVQEQVRNKELDVHTIDGADNMADLLAKNLDRPVMANHLTNINIFPETGRAEAAPQLA